MWNYRRKKKLELRGREGKRLTREIICMMIYSRMMLLSKARTRIGQQIIMMILRSRGGDLTLDVVVVETNAKPD